ncbi:MAG: peroxiredoxin family protein [Phycisphaerae bacterium]
MLNRRRIPHIALVGAICASAASLFAANSAPLMGLGGAPAKAAGADQPAITGDGKAEATLTMDVRRYDFEGTKTYNRMYMPTGTKLSPTKPEGVTKEPHYDGTPKYGTIKLGNGTPSQFTVAIDESKNQDAKIYFDLNGDGDLTNDNTGTWQQKHEGKDGALPMYQGTWTFTPGYKMADGSNKVEQYALNFYWQPGRGTLNYYNASARVGKIELGGKSYAVTLLENDADGLFNKLYDPNKPIIVGEEMTKPVWLMLDGDQMDIRGTFPFGGMNYLATVSDDGSHLSLAPTFKVVQPPRPVVKNNMLQAGAEAPDFDALVWKKGMTGLDTNSRIKLSDFRGKKIVVLDMWATWCGPCMRGIPHLNKVAQAVAGQDVEVIALNSFDDQEPFEKFAMGQGKDYVFTLARDPAGRDENGNTIAKKLYGVNAIPATFIIDKSGKIVAVISGYLEGDTTLEQTLKGLGVKID